MHCHIQTFSQDKRIEFAMEKCAMLIMKNRKRLMTDGIEISKHDKIRTLGERERYKYLGMLVADIIKTVEIKEKIKK